MTLSLLSLLKRRYPGKTEDRLYAYVLCGNVFCQGEKMRDPSRRVDSRSDIEIITTSYVSRGGYKLEGALEEWNIRCEDKVFIDAGASTGGFTDCLLQHGARLVYAVDVGYNQLAYGLRKDERVVVHERCNIMEMVRPDPMPHMGVADLSFRSITGAASHIVSLTREKKLIALIKPQFEIGRGVDFKGIVTDPEDWRRVLTHVCAALKREGLGVSRLSPSRVKGKKGGNREFLALVEKGSGDTPLKELIGMAVERAAELG